MRKLSLSLALSVGVALAGCTTLMPVIPAPGSSMTQPVFEQGDLPIALRIGDSRTLQAPSAIPVYDASSIAKLEIIPMLKVGNAFSPVSKTTKGTVEQGSADQLMMVIENVSWEALDKHRVYVLKNLAPNSTYRVQVKAYDSQGTQISKDETSFGDVVVATADRPHMTPAPVPLHLKDKPFQATAQVDLSFTGGDLGETQSVVLTLFKKVGGVDTPVGTPVTLTRNELSGRRLMLGGLAPTSEYVLKAVAYDGSNVKVTETTLPLVTTNLPSLGTLSLVLTTQPTYSLFAGGGSAAASFDGVDRLAVAFDSVWDVVKAPDGAIFVVDRTFAAGNNKGRIHRIAPDGKVTTMATGIDWPVGAALDSSGNLFVAGRACIWKLSGTSLTVFAGTDGQFGATDGTGAAARFMTPRQICVDAQDNLYVVDYNNHNIRKVTPDGVVTTVAGGTSSSSSGYLDGIGTNARFSNPFGITIDRARNELYVADTWNHRIRKIDLATSEVSTFAGAGAPGELGSASLSYPRSIRFTEGGLYVGDEGTGAAGRVYRIANGKVGPTFQLGTFRPTGLDADANAVFVADDYGMRVLRIVFP